MSRTVSWYTADVTNERLGRMMTDSDDQEVHVKYFLECAFIGAVRELFRDDVQFPFQMKCSIEQIRENMNIKYKLTLEIEESNASNPLPPSPHSWCVS